MKHKIFILLVFTFISIMSSVSANTTFQRAADAYNAQRYADAVALYDSVEVADGVSPQLYYNRGNAYYKMGKYAPAILNYERALMLDPSNPDISYNLELANTKIADKIEETGTFFINVWAQTVRDWFTSNTWAVIGIISFLMFMIAFVTYMFVDSQHMRVRKWGFFIALPLFIISLIANACALAQNDRSSNRDQAIIFAGEVSVKSSPSDSGTQLFVLHAGTKVTLIETVGEWGEVRISDGNRGWLPLSAIEII